MLNFFRVFTSTFRYVYLSHQLFFCYAKDLHCGIKAKSEENIDKVSRRLWSLKFSPFFAFECMDQNRERGKIKVI